MRRQVTTTTGGALTFAWDLTVEQLQDLHDLLFDMLGVPTVTHADDGEVDLAERVRVRMEDIGALQTDVLTSSGVKPTRLGEVGQPRREIVVEPVPERRPEPIETPAPSEPAEDPVPA